jgi:hypothetical protein
MFLLSSQKLCKPAVYKAAMRIIIIKLQLHSYYSSQLDSSFDVNRMRTWKTYCSKCRYFNLSCCS